MNSALPTLSQTQARKLLGVTWKIQGEELRFGYSTGPRRLHWRTGGEAIAYAMTDGKDDVRAYLRFLDAANPRLNTTGRIRRTEWLIGQRLDQLSPQFAGAPSAWVSTFVQGRPAGIDFDLTATLLHAVPGRTWRDWKSRLDQGFAQLSYEVRLRAAKELLEALVQLEALGMIHGDLSDGNIIIDEAATAGSPVLYLIDFDAFVAKGLPEELRSLSFGEGGVVGTPGYCPPELDGTQAANARPFSDKHARDVLLVELLCFAAGDPTNQSARFWPNQSTLQARMEKAGNDFGIRLLRDRQLLSRREGTRLSTAELASQLGLSVADHQVLNRAAAPVPVKPDRAKAEIPGGRARNSASSHQPPRAQRTSTVHAPVSPQPAPSYSPSPAPVTAKSKKSRPALHSLGVAFECVFCVLNALVSWAVSMVVIGVPSAMVLVFLVMGIAHEGMGLAKPIAETLVRSGLVTLSVGLLIFSLLSKFEDSFW